MLKKIFNIIKKVILAVLLIYAYNKLALPLNLIIPMNIIPIIVILLPRKGAFFIVLSLCEICLLNKGG